MPDSKVPLTRAAAGRLPRSTSAGLALALLAVLLIGALSWRSFEQVQSANSWVVHTQEVLDVVSQTLALLVDAETGQRGFLLTHDDRYLAPYEASVIEAPQAIARDRKSTRLN